MVLLKIDYNYIVVYPLSPYLEEKLQRVQKSAASFGNNRCAKMADIILLGWLPLKERTEMHILSTNHRALCNTFLVQLSNPAKTPNYYEPTLVCYTATGLWLLPELFKIQPPSYLIVCLITSNLTETSAKM